MVGAALFSSGSGSVSTLGRFLLTAVALATPLGAETLQLHFQKLDRTYESFVEELAPIVLGAMTIELDSPQHSLTIERHTVTLGARGGNQFRVRIQFAFHGDGELHADIEMGVLKSQLEDYLVLPSQRLDLAGRIAIDAVEDGYRITVLEVDQQEAAVKIDSRMASRIVPLCRQMALVLVALDCDALQETLSVVRVPMPAPGEAFLLPLGDLTADEIAQLEAFLERSRAVQI